jgi:rod shape-determining protein MreC
MADSRDDFVIAIRSAFLKKENKQRFSLIGLIFFSIIFLILGRLNFTAIDYLKISINEVIYRSSFIISIPENYLKNSYYKIQDHLNLYKEYSNIKSELKDLKSKEKIDNFLVLENERLKKAMDDYSVETDSIMAKVLIDKKSPYLRSIVISKGSKDNVKLGMYVLDNMYLVGKVVEVNFVTSRVLLLSDLNSKIPVSIEPGGIESILSGTGEEHGIIKYLKKRQMIQEKSIIYTSGFGGMFKPGIPIGNIIDKAERSEFENEKKVYFFSDFSQLKFVKIASFAKEEN